MLKKILKTIGIILLVLLIAVLVYLAYVFLSYYRIGDRDLPVSDPVTEIMPAGEEMKIVSWNIGFGAYEQDFTFFMDGGKESRARSKEGLIRNLKLIGSDLKDEAADLYLVQEVDIDSTRSWHVDEREYIIDPLRGYTHTFAQNYDSPYLMYPFTRPHGASKSGLLTFSAYNIRSAFRKELPVETGVTKMLDLDRCYATHRIPLDNGKELVLYNLHLSAYTSDGKVTTEQLRLLLKDMQNEYNKGNYCIAGGDFNKDLTGDSETIFGVDLSEYTWAQPIDDSLFEGLSIRKIVPFHEDAPVASCRNCDKPYVKGNPVLTVDGFLVSENVKVVDANVIDKQFFSSDHNPVYMKFILEETK